jgi:hypothetical protein
VAGKPVRSINEKREEGKAGKQQKGGINAELILLLQFSSGFSFDRFEYAFTPRRIESRRDAQTVASQSRSFQ